MNALEIEYFGSVGGSPSDSLRIIAFYPDTSDGFWEAYRDSGKIDTQEVGDGLIVSMVSWQGE